jgi:hypothetical protein
MRPVAGTALVWLVLVAAVASWIYRYVRGLPFSVLPWPIPSPRIADAGEALKTTAGVIALVGAVLTGVYSHRKQLLAESESRRADAVEADRRTDAFITSGRAEMLELSRRYSEALTQLGSDRAAIRLGGAYALARLADDWAKNDMLTKDWEQQRQTCVDVLCAYLRMPHIPRDDRNGLPPEHRTNLAEEDQVRDTVQRLLQDHLRPGPGASWSSHDIDLTGATLHEASLNKATFDGIATFARAHFTGYTDFGGATFAGHAEFGGARFTGSAMFGAATFEGIAGFRQAGFHDHDLSRGARGAWFGGARFAGPALFEEATFTGHAMFNRARFSDQVGVTAASFVVEPEVAGMSVEEHPELNGTPFTTWPEPNRARLVRS